MSGRSTTSTFSAARSGWLPRQRGQAIVEFLVASAVLVPLVVGVVLVGRLQDLRTATVQSARYAAFAAALADGTPADLQSEVRARFFSDPNRRLGADERHERGAGTNPHWTDVLRADPLIGHPGDVAVRLTNDPPPGAAARAMTTASSGVERIAALTGGTFDLERRGYFAAEVDVRIAEVPSLAGLRATPLSLRARARVLGGDWSSAGSAETAAHTAALVPTAPLRRLRPVIAPLAWALSLLEPALRDLCLGRVDPELVPLDRLGPPGSDDAGRWVAPCE